MRIENSESMSATSVGRILGVSRQAVGHWGKRGCPKNSNNTFDLSQVIQWREEQTRAELLNEKDSPALERKRQAEAGLKELDLEERLGQIVPLEEVEAGRVARVLVVKRALLGMPTQIASTLVGLDARQISALLKERVRGIIAEFAGQRRT